MRAPILLMALAVMALLGSAVRPVWTLDPDAAAYVSLARALDAGEGYVLGGVPHGKYPPGFPWLLAGAMRVAGPDAYGVFHGVLVVLTGLIVLLAYALVRRLGYPEPVALAVAACTGLCQTFFQLSVEYLRTEVPFTALSLGALLATLRTVSREGRTGSSLWAGLLTAAAILTRLAGVTLLVVPAFALLRPGMSRAGRGRALLVLILGGVALAAWTSHANTLRRADPSLPDYGRELAAAAPRDLTKTVPLDMPELDARGAVLRVRDNVLVLARACAVLFTNVDKAAARLPVGLAALALLVLGLLAVLFARTRSRAAEATAGAGIGSHADPRAAAAPSAHRVAEATSLADRMAARRLAALSVAASLGLYLIWPFNQQERFYVPLLPLLLVLAGEGVLLVAAWLRRALDASSPWPRALLLGAAALLVVVLALQRSDHPVLFGRWSKAYAGLLGVSLALLAALAWAVRARFVPTPRPGMAWLVVVLFAAPFAHLRFVEWPAKVAAFEARRAGTPATDPAARIDVHPVLEDVAAALRAHAEPRAVVMSDVPKMLAVLTGMRAVPIVYRLDPPGVVTDGVDFVFETHDLPEVTRAVQAASPGWSVVFERPIPGTDVVARLYRVR